MVKIKRGVMLFAIAFCLSSGVDLMMSLNVTFAVEDQGSNTETDVSGNKLLNDTKSKTHSDTTNDQEKNETTSDTKSDQEKNEATSDTKSDQGKTASALVAIDDPKLHSMPKNDTFNIVHIVLAIGLVFNFIFTVLCTKFLYKLLKNALKQKGYSVSTKKDYNNFGTDSSPVKNPIEDQQAMKTISDNFSETYQGRNRKHSNSSSEDSSRRSTEISKLDAKADSLLESSKFDTSSGSSERGYFNDSTDSNKSFPAKKPTVYNLMSDFKKMLDDISKTTSIWENRTIIENFASQHGVVAFKCVNSEMRVNQPTLSPQFEKSTLDSKFWGIPLANGTMAVFPNPSWNDYEYSIHYQGGMKEMFKVLVVPQYIEYSKGRYQKIRLQTPAIVTSNFQILKQGELHLA